MVFRGKRKKIWLIKLMSLFFIISSCHQPNVRSKANVVNPPREVARKTSAQLEEQKKLEKEQKKLEIDKKISDLNKAGHGSVVVCDLQSIKVAYNSYPDIGGLLGITVSGSYNVNTVALSLDKSRTEEFVRFISESTKKAVANKGLENLRLGTFETSGGWVSLTSEYGWVNGFWAGRVVKNGVSTSIEPEELIDCVNLILPHL